MISNGIPTWTLLTVKRVCKIQSSSHLPIFSLSFSIFSSCRDNPVHLFDAYTGQVRASYKALNHLVKYLFRMER